MGCSLTHSKSQSLKQNLSKSVHENLSLTTERKSVNTLKNDTLRMSRISMSSRGATLNPRRSSLSPSQLTDFWGTMPLPVVIDRYKLFYEEIMKGNGNVNESIEYIQTILNDLSENFIKSKYRVIKKTDSKFKNLIGKYNSGVQFFRYVGFKELDDCVRVHDNLDNSNLKNIIKGFEAAVKRVEEMKSRKSLHCLT